MNNEILPNDYKETLELIIDKIKIAQQNAVISANYYLLNLYWEIGNIIVDKKKKQGWGTGVIENLSKDLRKTFPTMKGFSSRNLRCMRQFAENYTGVWGKFIFPCHTNTFLAIALKKCCSVFTAHFEKVLLSEFKEEILFV